MRTESAREDRPTTWRWRVVQAGFLLTALAAILGLAAEHHWLAYFLDQPRVHYAAILAVGLVALAWRKRWPSALLCAVAFGLNVWCLLPVLRPAPIDGDVQAHSTVSVVHANIKRTRSPSAALIAYVESTKPDVLLFQEVTPPFLETVGAALPGYRRVEAEPREDTRGVAAFAAAGVRVGTCTVVRLAAEVVDRPCISMTIQLPAGPLAILGFHAMRPQGPATISLQAAEYRGLAGWLQEHATSAALVIGDFNATPWSRLMHGLLREESVPAAQGALFLRPTWPSGPLLPLGIPIDLAVHSGRARVVESVVGPPIGSDHRPLLCRVAVLSPPREAGRLRAAPAPGWTAPVR